MLPHSVGAVSRAHRLLDLLAAVLVVGGAALFGVAFAGLDRLRATAQVEYTPGMVIDRLAEYHRLSWMSWAGLAIIAAGVGVAVFGWTRHRARHRAQAH